MYNYLNVYFSKIGISYCPSPRDFLFCTERNIVHLSTISDEWDVNEFR